MESNVLQKRWVQGGNVVVDDLRGTMFTGENGAHTFQISGVDSAQETVEITGTITGRFLTATNVTVPLTGTVSGGVASLTLTEDCYVIPGRFVLSIYATNGSTTQCIYCAVGNVFRTQSDIIEYPSASIPDIEQIIADAQAAVTQINAEVTAAQAAVAAAQTAVDGIEAQRQTMIESIASVAGQGTDTTLSQSGVAADAKAAGDQITDLKSALSDFGTVKNVSDNQTITASTTTYYDVDIPEGSTCIFKNGSSNAAMVLYARIGESRTTITPDGVAKGGSYTFTAAANYDSIGVFANNTNLVFDFTVVVKSGYIPNLDGVISPDSFTGTDTEKLQAAFDYCIDGGNIIINRGYTLASDITVSHNSNNNHVISVIGIGKNAIINSNGHSFIGIGTNHSVTNGGCIFNNITFNLSNNDVLFNCATLIRLIVNNCVFSGSGYAFRANGTYMQSIYVTNCLIRGLKSLIHCNDKTSENAYDIRVSTNIIEGGVNVITAGRVAQITVINNLIEGLFGTPIILYGICRNLTIKDNFFEDNGKNSSLISNGTKLLDAYYQINQSDQNVDGSRNIVFDSNIVLQSNGDVAIKIPHRVLDGCIRITNNYCNNGYLLSVSGSTPLSNVIYMCNEATISDTNGTIKVITPSAINGLFS